MPRTAYIKSFGCQMNVYDTERMQAGLRQAGIGVSQSADEADIVILNSCHIREKAAEKIYSELGRLVPLKSAKPDMVLGVAGCVAQAEGEEMVRRQPALDLVFGPQSITRLPLLLQRLAKQKTKAPVIDVELASEEKFGTLKQLAKQKTLPRKPSAFLTIQEGCDKFCSFCVVPYTRGAEVSRPQDAILAEAKALLANGVRDITLLGQNVNAWQKDEMGFADLLYRLAECAGLERLRFTTSHPRDMTPALIEAFATIPVLMPYLHLPIQSGSDRVLRAMNRNYTAQEYKDIIARLRQARPDIALSSDFIVGFPAESEEDFCATLELVAEVGFAKAYSFAYSARHGTPAAGYENPIAPAVQRERLYRLQDLLNQQAQAFNQKSVGQIMPVLVERIADGQAHGRSPYLQAVHCAISESEANKIPVGAIVPMCITGASANSLSALRADDTKHLQNAQKIA